MLANPLVCEAQTLVLGKFTQTCGLAPSTKKA